MAVSFTRGHLEEMLKHFDVEGHVVLDYLDDTGTQCMGIVHAPADNPKIGLIILGALLFTGQDKEKAIATAYELAAQMVTEVHGMDLISYFPGGGNMLEEAEQDAYDEAFWSWVESQDPREFPEWPGDSGMDEGGCGVKPWHPNPGGCPGSSVDLPTEAPEPRKRELVEV